MHARTKWFLYPGVIAGTILLAITTPALAVDGVIEINQAKVAASGGFPFTIDGSALKPAASYRLTSDLSSGASTAINITAPGVTIDLNGFTIAASGPSAFGISASVPAVTIRNGIFAGSPMADISLGVGGIIENVQLFGTTATISCAGGCLISSDFFAGSNAPINDQGGSLIVNNVFAGGGAANLKMGTTTEYGNNVFNFAPTITGGVSLGAGNTNLCGTIRC